MSFRLNSIYRNVRRAGFTRLELFVVLGALGVFIALLMPAMRTSNEAARRVACMHNFKQLGLALHNYHAAHSQFPMAMGGTDGLPRPWSNAGRLNGLVGLLPFVEQQTLWEEISNPSTYNGIAFEAMGPAPWFQEYSPWKTEVPAFLCPSTPLLISRTGRTNYVFSIGDTARGIQKSKRLRGAFVCGRATRFEDIRDGTANTLAMAEIGLATKGRAIRGQFANYQDSEMLKNPLLCLALRDPMRPTHFISEISLHQDGRGSSWADGSAGIALFNSILPPNSPSCAVEAYHATDGLYAAGSFHFGGCHVLMVDGSVRFLSNSIDVGDTSAAVPDITLDQSVPVGSPYGLWGQLGTAVGGEMPPP
jgi:type II secretory pathway pseudopilin PulG